jgi:hypothetical protein
MVHEYEYPRVVPVRAGDREPQAPIDDERASADAGKGAGADDEGEGDAAPHGAPPPA